ncbi:MAG: glycosyltransferase family 25 protein [Holosporales bacterium]|jgi:glycosyl transferase family 25|nr:glycosyltransferase family 25 protein [Holosporales bacterium]
MKSFSKKIFFKRVFGVLLLLYLTPFFFIEGAFVHRSRPVEIPEPQHPQGIAAYVINLDRRTDRWTVMAPRMAPLGFPWERISAVDGKLLTQENINKIVDQKAFYALRGCLMKRGEIGCALSHLKAWETFLRSPYAYALIFEDDALFDPGKLREIVSILEKTPQDWDIVNFGMDNAHEKPLPLRKIHQDSHLVVYLGLVLQAGAYLINRKAAKALYAHALPLKLPVDIFFTRGWEFGLKFTGIEPVFVHQAVTKSDIGLPYKPPLPKNFVDLCCRRVNLTVARTKTNIMRLLYNLKLYSQFHQSD